jgi:hypothetical protein
VDNIPYVPQDIHAASWLCSRVPAPFIAEVERQRDFTVLDVREFGHHRQLRQLALQRIARHSRIVAGAEAGRAMSAARRMGLGAGSRARRCGSRNLVVPRRCSWQTAPVLLTIAGSSCSGKTTVARACEEIERLVVHDFDEIGVPAGADTVWRQRSMEEWIQRVLRYEADGLDVLLTGQSPLGEVLASPSAIELDGIAACLLDVDDQERWERLERRDPGRWNTETKRSLIGWARWHRGHAVDPRYRPEVITTAGYGRMQWSRWSNWPSADPRWAVQVVDTTRQTVDQSAADVEQWISGVRATFAVGQLPLGAGKWAGAPRR